ncbi:MAG: C4-dicarboxylate ABC transporter permease [Alphaproteobacteria bacterium HGW-Alphaproteobacteria-6]|nr:MAG: C4-dicarboxylate ABC transporter permease [Alphaproteobacteria bacterium HGW-Alphaproteobacteria-6]
MLDGILWVISGIGSSFGNLFHALARPGDWLGWAFEGGTLASPEAKAALMRFIYYGASSELFFVILTTLLILTGVGIWRRAVIWAVVRALEGLANGVGRFTAWAGLIMVLQQIVIVFLQRIFRVSSIELAPFGYGFAKDLSWWSEELKLYNAMIVALCVTYTFVQGGHVRVDLIYAHVSYRKKRLIDMFGSLFFMMPVAVVTWIYGWFFFWRVMIVPNPSASDELDKLLTKSRALRWNIETIGFSPNGFNAYFLFKVLMLAFVVLVFLQAVAFFYRSLLELVEGPGSEGKYLDRDRLDAAPDAQQGAH